MSFRGVFSSEDFKIVNDFNVLRGKSEIPKRSLLHLMLFFSNVSEAQGVKYAIQGALVKFDITTNHKLVLFPQDYYNGYELGFLVKHNPKDTFIDLSVGLRYEELRYSLYNLNFINLPLGLDLVFGKKAGVLIGGSIKFKYLTRETKDQTYSDNNAQRLYYSFAARLGLFLTLDKIKIQLFPQIESIQNPIFIAKYDHYINRVSYNLAIIF